ncbi:MAG TPA: hypothetical protein PKI19_13185 [Elusimicrobiales bacterium]|nr:hypothetical protein [Elusimicrobiales bacterium]
MISRAFLLCLVLAGSARGAELGTVSSVSSWHVKSSPHFEVLHESAWSPNSIILELEKMFSTMRLNMSMFAPWMASEKSKIYIYSSQASFLNGEFAPPKWSKGLAYPAKKTVVVYDAGDMVKLKAVLAHELSHLYFEGYFSEKLKYPPQWLNEGLAVYLEDIVFTEGGPWRRALPYLGPDRRLNFEKFSTAKFDKLGSDAAISDWYLQAFGTVSYLYRPHTRLQFKNFCDALRAGDKTETALWKSYRIGSGPDFTEKWEAWLSGYKTGAGSGTISSAFTFKPVKMSSFPFTNFSK